jgi:hypothetical protein
MYSGLRLGLWYFITSLIHVALHIINAFCIKNSLESRNYWMTYVRSPHF